ncbi:MAG: hypothetical protein H8D67_03335 [Deltaproteobacteria bacterium]|nr:hypothetical protein [Deltaproteobacteria bacterium]
MVITGQPESRTTGKLAKDAVAGALKIKTIGFFFVFSLLPVVWLSGCLAFWVEAILKAKEKYPNRIFYLMRVGYDAVHSSKGFVPVLEENDAKVS